MLIACKSKKVVPELKGALSREFEMKDLEPTKKILSMKIIKDRTKRLLHLSQKGYVKKILERFDIKEAKSVELPFIGHVMLGFDASNSIHNREESISTSS